MSNERKTLAVRALPYPQTASFEALCVKLSRRCARKKAGKKEEKSQEVYISRMRGATRPSRRIPISNQTWQMCSSHRLIERVKLHLYKLRGFEAVRC